MVRGAASGLYDIAGILPEGVFPDSIISGNVVYNPGQFWETRFLKADTEPSSELDTRR